MPKPVLIGLVLVVAVAIGVVGTLLLSGDDDEPETPVAVEALLAFNEQRALAADAEAMAAVRTAQTAVETIAVDNDGVYDGVTVARLQAIEPTLNDARLAVTTVAADSYSIRTTSETGSTFDIARDANGATMLTCAPPGVGGCPADGTW